MTGRIAITHRRSRGTVYVVVLATMSIVLTLTLSGLINARTELASASRTNEESVARSIARSGLEIAVDRINADPAWREDVIGGILLSNVSMGNGRFRVIVEDPDDGDLLDDYSEPILLTAIAQVGQSLQQYALRLEWADAHDMSTQLVLGMHPLSYWTLRELDGDTSSDQQAVRDARLQGTLTYDVTDATGNYSMPRLSSVDRTFFRVTHEPCYETDFGSVSFWMQLSSKYASSSLTQIAFAKFRPDEPDAAQPAVLCINGQVFLIIEIGGSIEFVSFGTVTGDAWHHVAITWGDDGWTAYLDGAVGGSIPKPLGLGQAWSTRANTSDITFGAAERLYKRSGGGGDIGHHLHGKVCEAAIFAYELSPAQVKQLARETPSPRPLRMNHESFRRVVN